MLYKLQVDPVIFEFYPSYVALVVYAEGLTNGTSDEYSTGYLRAAEEEARRQGKGLLLDDNEHIQAWRQAFKSFGAKPKRHFCGVEGLLRRVLEGASIPPVNRIVDVYNAVSMRYVVPVGGEDWDGLAGNLRLLKSSGEEPFITIGVEAEQIAYPSRGEIIWADPSGATVRRWNWRQCARTRVRVETCNAYFVLDRLEPDPIENLLAAAEELMSRLKHLSPAVDLRSEILNANSARWNPMRSQWR